MSIEQQYQLRFTRHAAQDLDDLFRVITYDLDAPQAAKSLMAEMESAISNLKEFPFSVPQSRDGLLARKGYRTLVIRKKYIVLYRIEEAQLEAIIQRILYGKRHYTKLL